MPWNGTGWDSAMMVHPPDTNAVGWEHIDLDRWGNPHIVYTFWPDWENSGNTDVYYVTFTGDTWTTPLKINPDRADHSQDIDVAVDTLGNVHFVWVEYYYGRDSLCYRSYDGVSLGPGTIPSSIYTYPNTPKIEADDPENIWVVWEDLGHVFAMHFDGTTWHGPQQADNGSSSNGSIEIALDSTGIPHTVWSGWVEVYPYDTSFIFYSRYEPEYVEENIEVGKLFEVIIYPNPVYSNNLRTQLFLNKPTSLLVEIFDISGRKIESFYYPNMAQGSHVLRLGATESRHFSLPTGKYFMKFNFGIISKIISFIILK